MTEAPAPVSFRPRGWRWASRAGLVLGYASLLLVTTTYQARTVEVRASRPQLGVIRLEPGTSPGGVQGWVAHFSLDVSRAQAWRILGRCEAFPKVLKGVESCELLADRGREKDHRMNLLSPPNAFMRTRTTYDPASFRSEWRMTEGSFDAAEGFVRLDPFPGQPGWCKVQYGYYLSISKLLPRSFEQPRTQRAVRRMAREIQDYFMGQATAAASR
jgi:YD repeat-containing protein